MSDDSEEDRCPTVDRVISQLGERHLPLLGEHLAQVSSWLAKRGALGLILVDATPLAQIERLFGARPFRATIHALCERIRRYVEREIEEEYVLTSGAIEEEQILVFVSRAREEAAFYSDELPLRFQELRAQLTQSLKKIAYPYLVRSPELPLGHGIAFHRPFQRPESQIRALIESTRATAAFEVERLRRDRGAALVRIVARGDLRIVYEPIVRLADGTVEGYEALTRGPVGSGLESPGRLFDVAEDCGLEYELDNLCRRRALAGAVGLGSGQKLFLNLLPTSIYDPDFTGAQVREVLRTLDLAPSSLVFEISERMAIANFPIFREAVDHLKSLGFGIALDDVGSGFSSLEAALELSPDYLKIDMSLVRSIEENPYKQELMQGLVRLAKKMTATVIAEGIETENELETIRELGVACGQGFLLGRGRPAPRRGDTPRPTPRS